jgi:ABC-2 type transport system ATP-binding protein
MRQTIHRLHRELGLTILLSSHLLTEVEQLCTRICVLNRGRLVFEGAVAATKEGQNWVRLRVSDFAGAVKELRGAGLITDEYDGREIALAAGASTHQIVRVLVGQGIDVFEITPRQRTLEDFYLSLMKENNPVRSDEDK